MYVRNFITFITFSGLNQAWYKYKHLSYLSTVANLWCTTLFSFAIYNNRNQPFIRLLTIPYTVYHWKQLPLHISREKYVPSGCT